MTSADSPCAHLPYAPHSVMIRSTERFLTTHTGACRGPDDLVRIMYAKEEGIPVDGAALAARIRAPSRTSYASKSSLASTLSTTGRCQPSYATMSKIVLLGSAVRGTLSSTRTSWTFPTWPSGFRRPRSFAPQDTCLQRSHQRAGRERGKRRRPKSERSARCGERDACIHERGFAGAHIAILSQRSLPKRGRLPVRDRRGDAPRV